MKALFIFLSSIFPVTTLSAQDPPANIFKDSKAGLEWQSLTGKMQPWEDAKKSCASLGKGWRLPTKEDFEKGLSSSVLVSIPNVIEKKDMSFWSQTKFDAGRVHVFYRGKLEPRDISSDGSPIIYPVVCSKQNAISVRRIVDQLDITSFPSSMGPRKQKGKIRIADYGFKVTETSDDKVVLDHSGDWTLVIKVLDGNSMNPIICFEDRAKNGGTYHTQKPYSLVSSSDKKSLIAEKKKIEANDCPEFAK